MNIKVKLLGAVAALALTSGAALAASTNPPGERAGLDLASPLPEGVYFVDLLSVGNFRGYNPGSVGDTMTNGNSSLNYQVPIIAWSTPWTLLGARVQLLAAAPMLEAGYNHINGAVGGVLGYVKPALLNATNGSGGYVHGMYNPFVAGQLAWNLGNGWSVSALMGAYLPISGGDLGNAYNRTTLHEQLAIAYHMNGWNFTANLMFGEILTQGSCSVGAPSPVLGLPNATCNNNDYFNYDLGLTHTFGKWEVGMVAFGSTDFNVPGSNTNLAGPGSGFNGAAWTNYAGQAQSQFALGGLVGYNFGPVITQLIVASDVYEHNYQAHETQVNVHLIVPLWAPEAPKAVVAKY
ncbi:MAG: hypothetical protein ACLPIC_13130 [Rhodoblastus sp.]|uniref:hypothetical protein n=1 Tax=Rhodoblastus sp. TaxID=1962975 RepID=UPI003F9B323D